MKPMDESMLGLAGVDEVGRGPLAGPVVAAAVILPLDFDITGLRDSKKLSARQREGLYEKILGGSICVGVGRAEVHEIDAMNILRASLLAMSRAIEALTVKPLKIEVDGLYVPTSEYPSTAIVKGDAHVPQIAAASIVAKVVRDREMADMEIRYPGYGFAAHSGYPTQMHLEALDRLGPCEIHRRTFGPVKRRLAGL
jgi:ribonuclease HII